MQSSKPCSPPNEEELTVKKLESFFFDKSIDNDEDFVSLLKTARFLGRKYKYDHKDLLRDSFIRARQRLKNVKKAPGTNCPRQYIAGVMQSVANDHVEKIIRQREILKENEPIITVYENARSGSQQPDIHVYYEQLMNEVYTLFSDRTDAQRMLEMMSQEFTRKEIMEEMNISTEEHDNLRKLIRRRFDKHILPLR